MQTLSRIFAQSLARSELASAGGGLQGAALRCCSRATRDLAGLRPESRAPGPRCPCACHIVLVRVV